jgi:L-lactate dehydrogenase
MSNSTVRHDRIAIIGCGHVGSTCAYALMMKGTAREIILIDADGNVAESEAMDLQHAASMNRPVHIRAGDYKDAAQSSIVIITAGVGGSPGESRLDLLARNVGVVRECMKQLGAEGFAGILLMTTNPVDVLTQVAQHESGFPAARVIGSGTLLDSARLRAMIGAALSVEARSVHAYIIGEHGDSEIAAFSSATIAGVPLREYAESAKGIEPHTLLQRVRSAAPDIIRHKGYTSFAIASCVARICEAILRDEHAVLPVSTLLQGEYGIEGVYLSVPCIIGRAGIERVIEIPLDESERAGLHASAQVLRQSLREVRVGGIV